MTPQRLLVMVGIPLGLLIALLAPAWTAYDEFTHFARVVDIAQGNLEPTRSTEGIGSRIPTAHREATGQIILDHQEGRPPWSPTSIRALLDHRPDGRTTFIDTRPTTASTPVAYLPAAAGAWVPVALDAPGLVVLWASRLASLAAYLAIAVVAVRSASAFRWSLTASALVPLNLGSGLLGLSGRADNRRRAPRCLTVDTGGGGRRGRDVSSGRSIPPPGPGQAPLLPGPSALPGIGSA